MALPPDPKTPAPPTQPSPMPPGQQPHVNIVCRQAGRPIEALGIAVELMFRRRPFADFRFGQVVLMLRGQITRGHYLIAYRDGRPVGYSGWAECSREIGERWLREGYAPTHEECMGGDCAMLITVVSSESETTAALIHAMRARYPNRRVYFKREYAGGKTRKAVAFNRAAAGADTPPTPHGPA
jgi:hemolysin-activating ACP:hemolysin acyltransferase